MLSGDKKVRQFSGFPPTSVSSLTLSGPGRGAGRGSEAWMKMKKLTWGGDQFWVENNESRHKTHFFSKLDSFSDG